MKKYAIVTQYYKSINYGGNLQAYALCEALRKMGIYSEQICYPFSEPYIKDKNRSISQIVKDVGFGGLISLSINKISNIKDSTQKKIKKILLYKRHHKYIDEIAERRQAFEHFSCDMIPHSKKVYYDKNFIECIDGYDGFITGSDQVWNFAHYRREYFLKSVPKNKVKISYAASMAMNKLNYNQQEFIKDALKDFKAISVREEQAVNLLEECMPSNTQIRLVLDPTLLLNKDEWEGIASNRLIKEDYVFCYFLGKNKKSRHFVKKYSKIHKLQMVSINMANDGVCFYDDGFADIECNMASPEDYLSLVKYSKYVFTDSFHTAVFALLFNKKFVVFDRDNKAHMSSRIVSLMKLFHTEERYVENTYDFSNIDEIVRVLDADASYNSEEFNRLKEASMEYLFVNLRG